MNAAPGREDHHADRLRAAAGMQDVRRSRTSVGIERADVQRQHAPAGNVSAIAAELMAIRCRWCNDELEHCHESLIVHVGGDKHCMSTACVVAAEAHHLVVRCDDFGCTCSQAKSDAVSSRTCA